MEDSLIQWINTFDSLPKNCSSFEDLSDGTILAEVVAQITGRSVDARQEVSGNDYLKLSNLKRVVSVLGSFYQEDLNLDPGVETVDVKSIASDANAQETVRLVQLVLGAAIECANKVEYIQKIQTLAPSAQGELVVLIQAIMQSHSLQKSNSFSHDLQNHDEDFLKELDEKQTNMNEELGLQYERLQNDFFQLQSDHSSLQSEISRLKSEKQSLVSHVTELEDALEKSKEEKTSLMNASREQDSSFDVYRNNANNSLDLQEQHKLHGELEEKADQIADLKKKLEEYAKIAQESRSLRDENDILREKAERVPDLEDRLKKLQVRAEQANDLRKQLKVLEDQNDVYMKSKIELEDSEKKTQTIKAQLDKYKDQVTSMSAEISSLSHQIERKDSEIEKMKEEYEKSQHENRRLSSRLTQANSELEHLRAEQESKLVSSLASDLQDQHIGDDRVTDLSVKEKLMRLELENVRLKASGGPERVTELEEKLDDAIRLNTKYAQDLENIKAKLGSGGSGTIVVEGGASNERVKQLEEENKKQLEEINSLLKEKQKFNEDKQNFADATTKLKAAAEKISALSAEKVKLEGYLRTAKTMIRDEREKSTNSAESQKIQKTYEENIQLLKNQIKAKDEEIAHLKGLLDESKESSAREQKLLSSSLYEMGLELQRLKAPKPSLDGTPSKTAPKKEAPKSLLGLKRAEMDKR